MTASVQTAPKSPNRPIPPWITRQIKRTFVRLAVVAAVLACMICLGTAPPPPPMHAVNDVAVEAAQREPLAPIRRFVVRDGTALAYRAYPAAAAVPPRVVAVLIHGSGGSSVNMNVLGRALARSGISAYALDIRGQGLSGRRGDIDYIGQQEDDLIDVVKLIRRDHPHAKLVLAGHSSGGGFTLRVAGEPGGAGRLFDHFVLLAPALGQRAPAQRPTGGGWVSVFMPRVIALTVLNRFGMTAFNGLPVLAFALPPAQPGRPDTLTRTWSYRMMQNFAPHGQTALWGRPWRDDAARAVAPIRVLAGSNDESFHAERYAVAFAGIPTVKSVQVLPGVGHMGLISDPAALPAVVSSIRSDR